MDKRMDQAEYVAVLAAVHSLAQMLLLLPLGNVLQAMNRAETIGPILDPTLYLRAAPSLAQQKRLIRAFHTAQCEIKAAIEDARQSGALEPMRKGEG